MRRAALSAAALALVAGAAQAQVAAPAAEDGPGPNLVIEVADAAGTSKGTITLDLFADKAPNHVARIVELAKAGAFETKKMAVIPIAEFRASPYILPDGPTMIGLMSSAFKGAMGTAALDLPGATKAKIGRLVYVEGDYVSIFGTPQLHMSIVRSADMNKTPDVRTRAILPEWACRVAISFVEPVIKQPAVVNLLSAAGITAGVGDWRPEKGKGAFGRFKLVNDDDPEFVRIITTGARESQAQAMEHPLPYDAETEELLGWYMDTAKAKGFVPTAQNGRVVEAVTA